MRYKLKILGVLVDNEIVVISWSIPSITLNKKHNNIVYHRVREAVAAGIISLAHITGKYNPSDLLNNTLFFIKITLS